MTNPFKRTALSDEHYNGTKRRALMGSLSSTAKGKALALSQYNFTVQESQFLCHMCFDPKPKGESFPINGCSHSYCKNCTANYIGTKLQQNMLKIRCPARNCSGLLEPHDCRSILPEEVFGRWDQALVLSSDRGDTITESECPNCNRLSKNEREREDIMLMKLAKNKQWRRCHKCNIFGERIEGCSCNIF